MGMAIKFAVVAAGRAAGSIFGASAGHASSNAPWCAVINLGIGDARRDCRYRTVEECVPNVLAGNRGSCSPNPYASAPAAVSVPSKGPINTTSGTAESRKIREGPKIMKTATKIAIVAAGLAASSMFGAPAGHAAAFPLI
jgi:hypothetical protein